MSFVDFKEVTSDNAGSATRYGGNDTKELMRIFNGKVVPSRRVRILNEWCWVDHFDMKPPGATPSNPPDANASRLYVDPTDFRIRIKKTDGSIRDIENIIIPDSALLQITDKSKLPTDTMYESDNNTLGDHFLEFGDISVPSNPAAGNVRLFMDSATGELSVRKTAGTTVSLETGGGGGGGGDVFLNQANTFGDFNSTFRSSRILMRNPANTFGYTIVASAIAAARNLTLPLLTANDQVTCDAHPTTFTGKTINVDTNTIKHSTNNNLGDLLIGNATQYIRLARGTASQLLGVNSAGTDVGWVSTIASQNINASSNTITDTSIATGDILKSNGTKFVRMARGTALQVLRTNSGATDLEYASLDSERIGKSTASGNGTTTVFNIAHGIGANPTYAIVSVAASGTANPGYSYTTDATNIIVTFNPAPTSGTNNVVIYWIAVA